MHRVTPHELESAFSLRSSLETMSHYGGGGGSGRYDNRRGGGDRYGGDDRYRGGAGGYGSNDTYRSGGRDRTCCRRAARKRGAGSPDGGRRTIRERGCRSQRHDQRDVGAGRRRRDQADRRKGRADRVQLDCRRGACVDGPRGARGFWH